MSSVVAGALVGVVGAVVVVGTAVVVGAAVGAGALVVVGAAVVAGASATTTPLLHEVATTASSASAARDTPARARVIGPGAL